MPWHVPNRFLVQHRSNVTTPTLHHIDQGAVAESEIEVDMAAAEAGELPSVVDAMPVPSLGLASHVEGDDATVGGSRLVVQGISNGESDDSGGHALVRSVRYAHAWTPILLFVQ